MLWVILQCPTNLYKIYYDLFWYCYCKHVVLCEHNKCQQNTILPRGQSPLYLTDSFETRICVKTKWDELSSKVLLKYSFKYKSYEKISSTFFSWNGLYTSFVQEQWFLASTLCYAPYLIFSIYSLVLWRFEVATLINLGP